MPLQLLNSGSRQKPAFFDSYEGEVRFLFFLLLTELFQSAKLFRDLHHVSSPLLKVGVTFLVMTPTKAPGSAYPKMQKQRQLHPVIICRVLS